MHDDTTEQSTEVFQPKWMGRQVNRLLRSVKDLPSDWLGWSVFALFLLWLSSPWWIRLLYYMAGEPIDKLGQTGDLFGSINAIFSGFALVGVVIAIHLQSKELKETNRMLDLQKKEMNVTSQALIEQCDLLRRQLQSESERALENKFREEANQLTAIINSADTGSVKGQDAFGSALSQFINRNKSQDHQDAARVFFSIAEGFSFVGSYCSALLHLLRELDNEPEHEVIKRAIARSIGSAMSRPVWTLVFYYALYDKSGNFAQLLNKYGILDLDRIQKFGNPSDRKSLKSKSGLI